MNRVAMHGFWTVVTIALAVVGILVLIAALGALIWATHRGHYRREPVRERSQAMILPDKPLGLSREDALKAETLILALQPFPGQQWASAVESYLILRWTLGLGAATAKEIVEALQAGRFCHAAGRTRESSESTVARALRENLRLRDPDRMRKIKHQPRRYAFPPEGNPDIPRR